MRREIWSWLKLAIACDALPAPSLALRKRSCVGGCHGLPGRAVLQGRGRPLRARSWRRTRPRGGTVIAHSPPCTRRDLKRWHWLLTRHHQNYEMMNFSVPHKARQRSPKSREFDPARPNFHFFDRLLAFLPPQICVLCFKLSSFTSRSRHGKPTNGCLKKVPSARKKRKAGSCAFLAADYHKL